jgi:hypothetical protein
LSSTICCLQAKRLLILKNKVVLAQFQNSAPQYLTLSEGFWRALSSLPLDYEYPFYRRLLQTYGSHYMSEGSLGGQYQALLEFDRDSLASTSRFFVFFNPFLMSLSGRDNPDE